MGYYKGIRKGMRRLVLKEYGKNPVWVGEEKPGLVPGHYLVKMAYAPINPSDLNYMIGSYAIKKELPAGFGFEGSGVIQDAEDKSLIGKKVAVSGPKGSQSGTFSTHLLSPIQSTIIWPDDADLRQVACSIVNPLTIVGFKHLINQHKYQNVLLSAANSQLARAAIQYLTLHKINVYGTVRDESQVEELLNLGAKRIFVGDSNLSELNNLQKLIFFDAIGGDFACKVFNNLPFQSKMVVYGRLSKQSYSDINPSQIYYKKKSIEGFWLNFFLGDMSSEEVQSVRQEVIENRGVFGVKVRKEFPLEKWEEAFEEARKGGSEGKVLFCSE